MHKRLSPDCMSPIVFPATNSGHEVACLSLPGSAVGQPPLATHCTLSAARSVLGGWNRCRKRTNVNGQVVTWRAHCQSKPGFHPESRSGGGRAQGGTVRVIGFASRLLACDCHTKYPTAISSSVHSAPLWRLARPGCNGFAPPGGRP